MAIRVLLERARARRGERRANIERPSTLLCSVPLSMRVYGLGERVSRRERRCQHFPLETPLDSDHARWDAVRGRLDGAGSRCYQPEAQGALTVPATQQGQAPCRSDSTLPTLTSADLTLPAHSAESRRTILRNSTPTRPRVLRGDGYATRTAAAETTRPRRRARGPVQVRV